MHIVCHLSYRDSEAIVHMKQNAIIPTEQKYQIKSNQNQVYLVTHIIYIYIYIYVHFIKSDVTEEIL